VCAGAFINEPSDAALFLTSPYCSRNKKTPSPPRTACTSTHFFQSSTSVMYSPSKGLPKVFEVPFDCFVWGCGAAVLRGALATEGVLFECVEPVMKPNQQPLQDFLFFVKRWYNFHLCRTTKTKWFMQKEETNLGVSNSYYNYIRPIMHSKRPIQ
jgi:hypothetical protein